MKLPIRKIIYSYLLTLAVFASADDTEIYGGTAIETGDSNENLLKPNVLFVFDTSGSMDGSRIRIVSNAVKDLANSLTDINLGLMRFDSRSNGGFIDEPIDDIENNRDEIISKVNGYSANGYTPLSESLYEAALYFRGDSMGFGGSTSPRNSKSEGATINYGSIYNSPVVDSCQKNHIILFSDGAPTADNSANNAIKSWLNTASIDTQIGDSCVRNRSGVCLDELAYYLKNVDQDPNNNIPGNDDVNITTHTIGGFDAAGNNLLVRTAAAGGGSYYPASSADELKDAFDAIFLNILSTSSSFTAPAASVSAFNISEHGEERYYAMFKPDEKAFWPGNLKKYTLGDDKKLRDANGSLAIDESTNYFSDTSKDLFNISASKDGNDVKLGGIVSVIEAKDRNIYSENSSGTLKDIVQVATKDLFNMASSTDDEFNEMLRWTQGYDVDNSDSDANTETRHVIGDPLHSTPVIINYGGKPESSESVESLDQTLFFGTNLGFLHAIDPSTGEEQFAFIPQELLKHQSIFRANETHMNSRPYGLDGPISQWINDLNNNKVVYDSSGSLESGEHVQLCVGMRRGGDSYYCLDVTDRNNPKLKFKIEGGIGKFSKLGQTWSKPYFTKIRLDKKEKAVMLFGGGYDTDQDNNTKRKSDDIGNAIYMVDALTGERIWWASNAGADLNIPEMTNSIPAGLAVVDFYKRDGFAEFLIAVDTGGRIFRIDFNTDASSANDIAKGGVIAQLSDTSEEGNRRFYYQPSVSYIKDDLYGDYLTISVGSGHRAHPVKTTAVENRMYVIKDYSPYKAPSTYTKRTEAAENYTPGDNDDIGLDRVYDATKLFTSDATALTSNALRMLNEGGGYYVRLPNTGEKVLAPATTFDNDLMFTTYTPTFTQETLGCEPNLGTGRLYSMSLKYAQPAIDLDGDNDIDEDDGIADVGVGIPPQPQISNSEEGPTILVGTEAIDGNKGGKNSKFNPDEDGTDCDYENCYVIPTYWRKNAKDFEYQSKTSMSE